MTGARLERDWSSSALQVGSFAPVLQFSSPLIGLETGVEKTDPAQHWLEINNCRRETPVDIGQKFTRRGQQYVLADYVPYITKDGRCVLLALLKSWCADCGTEFAFRVRRGAIRPGLLNRRCSRHKRPGFRVKTVKRPRKALKPPAGKRVEKAATRRQAPFRKQSFGRSPAPRGVEPRRQVRRDRPPWWERY
jgi:hypothetical protein